MNIVMTNMFKHWKSSKAKKESSKTMDYDPLQKATMKQGLVAQWLYHSRNQFKKLEMKQRDYLVDARIMHLLKAKLEFMIQVCTIHLQRIAKYVLT
jgi:hypothetical protein